MSFRRLVTTLTFLAVFAMATRVSTDTDTWWHLRAGAWITEHRQILASDPFSLTRFGEPWVYPGWLSQITLYAVFRLAGYAGLNLLTAGTVVVAFAFVWRVMEAPPLLRSAVLLLAVTASGVYWSARPQIFSLMLSGIFVWALERWRCGHRWSVWLLPVLMAIWSNLHGGFALGLILMAAYLAGTAADIGLRRLTQGAAASTGADRDLRRLIVLAGVLVLSVLAICANPHGPSMLLYPFKTVSINVLQRYIQEWQSPDFHRLEAQPFLWMFLLTLAAFAAAPGHVGTTDFLLVAGLGYLSFMAGRNIAIFALACAPALSRYLHLAMVPLLARVKMGREVSPRIARVVNIGLGFLAALGVVIKISSPLSVSVNEEALKEQIPVDAVAYLRENNPEGPLLNSYNWGGYVLWALYPRYRSFVDGRTDLFDDELLTEYLHAWRADPGWEDILEKWEIKLVLLEPEAPLSLALEWQGWKQLFADGQAVVLAKP